MSIEHELRYAPSSTDETLERLVAMTNQTNLVALDKTMAATDCAIKQVKQSVVFGDSGRNCVPSRRSNDWKPQKWAVCATVATRSKATPK